MPCVGIGPNWVEPPPTSDPRREQNRDGPDDLCGARRSVFFAAVCLRRVHMRNTDLECVHDTAVEVFAHRGENGVVSMDAGRAELGGEI